MCSKERALQLPAVVETWHHYFWQQTLA